ncbi:acyl-CoA-like ligand-binding transcription factor [Alicyclobacillus shizuokensis]|uniref:acyl-CoA-like ligand-binding transcription factor n=1 Tax=Alicyclobacillus shizuokensis TaxID=392014 RepID=UPI00082EDF39|nr:TetR family transcriptional regulator [Alicyclobacillus shizuokensis]
MAAKDKSTLSLRERKKAKTRATIQAHALRLFREQGYDETTVEQIIEAAEVSETTFFRYFPTKEDVVLQDDSDPILIRAFNAQPPNLAPIEALREAFRKFFSELSAEQRHEQKERIALILSVPKLRARMLDQFTEAMHVLAQALAERTGRSPQDFEIRVISGAIIGVGMAAMETMADDPHTDIASLMDQGFALLESGISL